MDMHDFLMTRVGFTDLPLEEIRIADNKIRNDVPWSEVFLQTASQLKAMANSIEEDELQQERYGYMWKWVSCAYHIASFDIHLNTTTQSLRKIEKLRKLATVAYQNYIRFDEKITSVTLQVRGRTIDGYFRIPEQEYKSVVVLVNGLDSICEVEMHAFGAKFLERGIAVLSLDIPAANATSPRKPHIDVQAYAVDIAEWIINDLVGHDVKLGVFGVSFGGLLVAQLLSASPAFQAGVAVSPPAWITHKELSQERIRRMFMWTFNIPEEKDIDRFVEPLDIHKLPVMSGKLKIIGMTEDTLFNRSHIDAYINWGGDRVETQWYAAEHVGTSIIKNWLPQVCDWMKNELSR
jgi:hypothetical protein